MTNTSQNVIVKVKSIVLNFPRKLDSLQTERVGVAMCSGWTTRLQKKGVFFPLLDVVKDAEEDESN